MFEKSMQLLNERRKRQVMVFSGVCCLFCLWPDRIGCNYMVLLPASCTPAREFANNSQGVDGTVLQPLMSVPEVFSSNWNSQSPFKY